MYRNKHHTFIITSIILLLLSACSGGGGNGGTNTAPSITSPATATVEENTTAVMTVSATDAEGDTVTYSLTGSVDDALFTIGSNSGALSFIVAPDFEAPTDNNTNNVYDIQVTVSDGTLTTSQTVSITVTDVFDMSVTSGGVKTLTFSWSAYSGASYYKLLVNPGGASGYTQEGSDIAGTTVDVVIPVHLTDWINASYMLEAYDASNNLLTSSNTYYVTSLMLSSIGNFKASNTGVGDYFGWSVALSDDGTTLAVGAPYEDGIAGNSGAVYLFRYSSGAWTQQAYIKASNAGQDDLFGVSVALSDDGNTLAVGARLEDSTTTNSGAVYLFRYSGSAWNQQTYLKASNPGAVDWYGESIALSGDGNTLAVGAFNEDSASTGINSTPNDDGSADDSGAVYLFRYSGSAWSQQAYLKASNTSAGDYFGYSVALSDDGNTLSVGAYMEDSTYTDSGAVYIFRYSGSAWAEQVYLKASNNGTSDWFGNSVALSDDGNTLAVGAWMEDSSTTGINTTPNNLASGSGAAYLFRFDGSNWAQQAYIKSSNTGASDFFGYSVALSDDGNSLVVGAVEDDSATAGINSTPEDNGSADDSGAAYLFLFDGSTWAQQAYIKASNTGASDFFGDAVSLSGDGNILAIGAQDESSAATGVNSTPNDDDGAYISGAVYMY